MSKRITKVLAALGVITGLGIAALPLSSYAANDVLVDVIIASTTDTGTCDAASDICTGGGNNAAGYTMTITDTSGTGFNLAPSNNPTGGAAANPGGTAAAPTNIVTITSNAAGVATNSNTYGVKYRPDWEQGGGVQGDWTFTTIAWDQFGQTQATVGSIASSRAGKFKINHDVAHSVTSAVAAGTYTNTVTMTWVAK